MGGVDLNTISVVCDVMSVCVCVCVCGKVERHVENGQGKHLQLLIVFTKIYLQILRKFKKGLCNKLKEFQYQLAKLPITLYPLPPPPLSLSPPSTHDESQS